MRDSCGRVWNRRSAVAVCALVTAAALVPARAEAYVWSGGDSASKPNWTDGKNWVGLVAPASNGTASIVYAAAPATPASTTVDSSYAIQSLAYNAGAPAYTVTAAAGAALTIGSGGITDNSTAVETISTPVILSAAQTWSVTASSGDLAVSGAVSGTGPLTVSGPGEVTLTASNSYTGGTILASGTLAISGATGADNALGNSAGALTFTGGTLQIFGPPAGISSRNINVNTGGGTIQTVSNFFLAGPITGTGTLTKTGDADLSILGDNGGTFSGSVSLLRGSTTLYTYGDQPLGTGSVILAGGSALNLLDQIAGSPGTPATTFTPLASAGTFTYGAGGGLIAPTTASTDGGSIFITKLGGSTDGATANLARASHGTLIIAPANGTATANLGVYEKVAVTGTAGNLPTVANGIVSPTIVGQNDDGNFTGDFLTYNTSAGFVSAASAYTSGFAGGATQLANITTATAVAANTAAFAARINAVAVTLAPSITLTIGDGTSAHAAGIIFNGAGAGISGGTLALAGSEAAIYTAQSATISSSITGSNGVTAFGPGTLTLTGSSSYTGPTTLNGVDEPGTGPSGTLLLASAGILSGGGAIAVNPYSTLNVLGKITGGGTVTIDGTLIGSGNIAGPVSVNGDGFIDPGSATIPTVLSTGNLSLLSGATATFGLNLLGVDSLNVTGTVSLGGATLDVLPLLLADVVPGTNYFLIANDSTDPVVGTFANLPQGAFFTAPDGVEFEISYTGDSVTHTFAGTGNDVVLEAVSAVPEPTSIATIALVAGMLSVRRRARSG